jgi:aminoglycoside/choline kinase family phosphotransferase
MLMRMTDGSPLSVDDPRLNSFLSERFGKRLSEACILPLAGDASTRRYFRVIVGADRVVLSVYPEPFDTRELSFVEVRDLLAACGLPVPEVLACDEQRGILLLEDLGDATLQSIVAGADDALVAALYDEALDALARLQRAAIAGLRPAACLHVAFDVEKLSWELHYFAKHFLEGLRGCNLSTEDRAKLAESFHDLSEQIAGWPRVLCHRDYHSRNLMHHRERLYWLDFQDARMGPATYDLASLLRDSYVDLGEEFVAARVAAFHRAMTAEEPYVAFLHRFELTCVQRNLKALGTFGYMASVRGSKLYAQYVPRTLEHARRNLERHPELDALRKTLARHVEELS